jgi:HlyD family secretion protein/epimerase transport system membrane fusion protein
LTGPVFPDFDFSGQIRRGLLAIGLLLVFVVGWSLLAPLSSGAIATGHIVVDSNRKELQHLDGGIVAAIHAKDGDRVSAGDLLIALDTTELQGSRDKLEGEWLALLAEKARLDAEFSRAADVTFPSVFRAAGAGERKREHMRRQRALFVAHRESLAGETGLIRQQIDQYHEQIAGLGKQVQAFKRRLDLLDSEIAGLSKLRKKGLAPKTRLLELQRRAASVLGDQASSESAIAETRILISEAKLQILQTARNVRETVSDRLSSIGAEIFDVEDRLKVARQRLIRTQIVAPSEGTVFNSKVHTVGGVIPKAETIMEIVPLRDRLVVEAEASPLDIDVIHVGDTAKVRLSALSARLTPLLDGRLDHVAPDRSINSAGNPVYILRVIISSAELAKLDGAELVPGMPVEVLIDKGEQSLMAYLLKPLTSILFRALKEN